MRIIKLASLAGLLAFVVWRSLDLKFFVRDLDIWWHLKVGDWISEHHAFPHNGIFSRTAADRPWAAYSWGFELMLSRAYHWLDLIGMGIFGTLLTVAVAFAVYWMARRLSQRFWFACAVATAACSAFLFNLMPRPVFFSMIFFAVLLALILEAQRSGRVELLYWLPLIFVLWANIHIQFIYGLAIVGLLAAVTVLQDASRRLGIHAQYFESSQLSAARVSVIFGACVVATCIGPYSYHLYAVVYQYGMAKVPYKMIRELQPLNFRAYSHYVQLLLTGAAFFAVGRQKKINLFKVALLVATSVLAYRTMRDAWFICIAAAACISDFPAEEAERERPESFYEMATVCGFLVLAGFLFARSNDFNREGLDAAISHDFPVKAVNFLRQNPQPGALYNSHDWGGFLIWYMPDHPVAIDGRGDLYGDDIDGQFFNTANGDQSPEADPYLKQSGIVLFQKEAPLSALLSMDPQFQKIYEDRIAVVYVRKEGRTDLPALPSPVSAQIP